MEKYTKSLGKISYYLILAVSVSLPFSIRVNSVLLIITFIFCALHYFSLRKRKIEYNKEILLLIGLYFMCFIGFFNSENLKPVFFDLEQKAALLALPLIFMMAPKFDRDKTSMIIATFIAATLVICLLNFRHGFYWGYSASDEMFEKSLLMRRPYLGMYCAFCIFFCMEFLFIYENKMLRLTSMLLTGFFLFFLVALFAKMALVTCSILLIFYILWRLFEYKKYMYAIAALLFVFSAFTYSTLINTRGKIFTKKILTFSEFDWNNYNAKIINSVNLRFIKWSCSVKVLAQDRNWVWGAGTGDSQQELNNCYSERLGKDSFFVKDRYNSHNQYFTTWLNLGLVSFLFFVIHFIILLYGYFIQKDLLALLFTLGIMFFCITESIFEVQKGVVFYSFLQCLFIQNKQLNSKKNISHD